MIQVEHEFSPIVGNLCLYSSYSRRASSASIPRGVLISAVGVGLEPRRLDRHRPPSEDTFRRAFGPLEMEPGSPQQDSVWFSPGPAWIGEKRPIDNPLLDSSLLSAQAVVGQELLTQCLFVRWNRECGLGNWVCSQGNHVPCCVGRLPMDVVEVCSS